MENVNVIWKINIHGVEDDGTEYDIDFPFAGFSSYERAVQSFFVLADKAFNEIAINDCVVLYSIKSDTNEPVVVPGHVYWQFFFSGENPGSPVFASIGPTQANHVHSMHIWSVEDLRAVHAAFCQPESVQIGI
jgi:hypothetical protein